MFMPKDSGTAERRGWYFYDWANSAFSTTVVTLFYGPYLTSIAVRAADAEGFIYPLGLKVLAQSYWGYLVSLSVFCQVLILPVIGALADRGRKKDLLALLAYLGAGATIAMFWLEGSRYLLGGGLFLLANLAFGASLAVYNSFLPDIAPPEERDAVSARGWGLGYLGGGLLLALNLVLYTKAESFGIEPGFAVRLSLCSAGVWWAAFTLIPLATLKRRPPKTVESGGAILQIIHTFRGMRAYPQTLTFLIAYLLYNDAVQAVIALASQFGSQELNMPMSQLTAVILMVQFVAFFGALLFNRLAGRIGAKLAIACALVLWTGVLAAMYGVVTTSQHFFIAAAVVALVMGGTQALSRSLFSTLIPPGREAEYFSVYEITDKGTSWICPLIFGLAMQLTRSYRISVLSLVVFFVAGLMVLLRVDPKRGALEAARGEAAA
ncbi:MAG: MFS transporter [Acidobacteria bacterium]|nr:MFS transporter [Acidobacteriota bacterium]